MTRNLSEPDLFDRLRGEEEDSHAAWRELRERLRSQPERYARPLATALLASLETGAPLAVRGSILPALEACTRDHPDALPPEVLEVLFPVTYWDLIQKYTKPRGLDPYLIAALMAQESTFDARIRSHANAIGLMQIVPATGRRYARRLKIPRFSTARLTDPEVNVRIGTAYFADMTQRFGGVHHALASYNAGPSPVSRWIAEKPGVATDEFIDDIPYPETQNYVKRILGTADDYRRLYQHGGGRIVRGAPGTGPAAGSKR